MLTSLLRSCVSVLCAASLLAGAPALAQTTLPSVDRVIPIPVKAKRANIEFNGTEFVLLDGKKRQLAPGVRIFGDDNMLKLYGSLKGTYKTKFLLEESTGLLQNIWILTAKEIATPDPKPDPATTPPAGNMTR